MTWLRFIPESTNIDFVRWRYYAFAFDGLLLVIAIVSIVVYGFNLGIDFKGGVVMEIKSAHFIDVGAMRREIATLNFRDTRVQYIGNGACDTPRNSCVEITVQPSVAKPGEDQNTIAQAALMTVKGKLGPSYNFRDVEAVGATVSQELFHDGIIATIAAVIMISIYVAVRFEWQYGVGALVATGHDVFVAAGLFSVTGLEFSINSVAALLLLAGYSINDTVVVFDRLRENRRKFKRMPLPELINLSTNQIATRTTLVSLATALAVIPLLFGGPVLFNFAAPILFGIFVGTFSSTYVAAMLLLYMPKLPGAMEDARSVEVKM